MKRIIILIVALLFGACFFNSCEKAPEIVTVIFDANGGRFADGTATLQVNGEIGSALTAPEAPLWDDAHTFQGWEPAVPAKFPETAATYKAKWSEVRVKLTFDANGGKFSDGSATTTLEGLVGAALTGTPADPTWDAYHTFKSWEPSVPKSFPATDTKFTAQWEAHTVKVTFKAFGGKFVDGKNTFVVEGIPGEAVNLPAAPVWGSNHFAGWDSTISVIPEKDTTVKAIWDSMEFTVSGAGVTSTFKLIRVKAGKYYVGSPVSELAHLDDEFRHEVTFTKDFYIGETEFTQGAWTAVAGSNPSWWTNGRGGVAKNTEDYPVENITWFEICGENADYGKDSFMYKLKMAVRGTMGEEFDFRLPTEAEWETACRGGQTQSLPFGIGTGRCLYWYMANFGAADCAYDMDKSDQWDGYVEDDEAEFVGTTLPVKTYKDYSNGYGLYDMHGNVAEWCWDWYDEAYYSTTEATVDPKGISAPGRYGNVKVIRGGWGLPFDGEAATCRSAFRRNYPVIDKNPSATKGGAIGFRLCMTGFNK